MQKGVITLPFRGSDMQSIVDAQHTIDRIFKSKNDCVGSVLQNDENALEQINHINLDVLDDVESTEVRSARIFPNIEGTVNHISDAVEKVKVSEIAQEGKEFIYGLFRFATLSAKVLLHVLLLLDRVCERILMKFQFSLEKEAKTQMPVETTKAVHYSVDKTGVMHSYKNNTGTSLISQSVQQKNTATETQFERVHTSFKESREGEGALVIQRNEKKHTTSVKPGIFVQVIAIIYTEIVYGGRLKDIDSI